MQKTVFILACMAGLSPAYATGPNILASDFSVSSEQITRIADIELREWLQTTPKSFSGNQFADYQQLPPSVGAVNGTNCDGKRVQYALGIYEDHQGYYRAYVRLVRASDKQLWTLDAVKETVDSPVEIIKSSRNLRTADLCG